MSKNFHIIDTENNFTTEIKNSKKFPYLGLATNNNKILWDDRIKIIQFKDPEVKRICVENWGGHIFEGEITKLEASQVIGLDNAFRNNTNIEYFEELQYFTNLTYLQVRDTSTNMTQTANAKGCFQGCTNLKKIIIPNHSFQYIQYAFYNCINLESDLNFNKITTNNPSGYRFAPFKFCKKIKKIIMPSFTVYATSNIQWYEDCFLLEYLDMSGLNWANFTSNVTNMFKGCNSLTTIIGGFKNLKTGGFNLSMCPLDYESITTIINNFAIPNSTQTFKVSSYTYNLLTSDDLLLATSKNWNITH